jgi:uncharacterized protein
MSSWPPSTASSTPHGTAADAYPPTVTADDVIAALALGPHPEGGWFAQTWLEPAAPGERPASSAIHYLLRAGERSHWHRVDATEVWHHYAGAPLELRLSADGDGLETCVLGADLTAGERPQVVVPAGAWQAARSLGDWTLVGCTVAPAFTFAGFELAPPGWEPGGGEGQGDRISRPGTATRSARCSSGRASGRARR